MLSGHDHDFEVFRRQNAYSRADRTGLQQFVVGTGGKASYPFGAVRPNSVVRRTDTFGFLSIRLRARSYSWSFIDESGSKLASGASRCMRDRARRY
jgi:hypothetical protein